MLPVNNKKSLSDEQLVPLALDGDEEAETLLFARYVNIVRLRASVYHGSSLEPDDLAQEGLIGFMRAIRYYNPGRKASFRTFALLCIDRSIITAVRKSISSQKVSSGTRKVSYDDVFSEADSPVDTSDGPEAIVIAQENSKLLKKKLAGILSELEYNALILCIGGCSYSEIAKRLSTDTKTVDNAIYRAKNKFIKLRAKAKD